MDSKQIDNLQNADKDGMLTYEFIVNNAEARDVDFEPLAQVLCTADRTGQFTASAARYLHAVDAVRFAPVVSVFVAATIDRDREHRYLPDLMLSIYGADYERQADRLAASDDNFRRLYKRLTSSKNVM